MAKTDLTPEEIAQLHASNLLDKAYALNEEYTELLKRRDANRVDLRNAEAQGFLSPEQAAELAEVYPPRKRNGAEEGSEAPEAVAA